MSNRAKEHRVFLPYEMSQVSLRNSSIYYKVFDDLRKYKPDPLSLSLYQAPSKKIEAQLIKERIDHAMLPDSTIYL